MRAKPDQLLVRFRADTANSVSRDTLHLLAEHLGFTNETQVIHHALSRLRTECLPAYGADDGDLTKAQIRAIKKAVPQDKAKAVKSSLV